MRTLIPICVLSILLTACTGDEAAPPVQSPNQTGPGVVVYEAGPMLAQCSAPAITVPQSAAKLSQAGIDVRTSSCGVMVGVFYPSVCGAGTGQIILHTVASSQVSSAEAVGFSQANSLVDNGRGTSWRRTHCGGNQQFIDFARQSASCANIRNRMLLINSRQHLDQELVLIDQLGNCADASYRQLLLGDTVDEVLCSNAQTIAGPVKRCPASQYASLFDIVIANLGKPDLGLGTEYDVWDFPL